MLFRQGTLVEGPVVAERKLARESAEWLGRALGGVSSAAISDEERMEQTWLLAHLLNGRDAERTVVRWLGGPDETPGEIGAAVAQRAAEIRARGADEAEAPPD